VNSTTTQELARGRNESGTQDEGSGEHRRLVRNGKAQGALAVADEALTKVDEKLGIDSWWWGDDPERRKAMSRARDFIQRIRETVPPSNLTPDPALEEATQALLERAAEDEAWVGRENAWDMAEELRLAWWRRASDGELRCLLQKEQKDETAVTWSMYFESAVLTKLLAETPPDDFRDRALEHLLRLQHERVDRVRHDRTQQKILQFFVWKLTGVIGVLFAACVVLHLLDQQAIVPIVAGALGAALSGALKIRDGNPRIRELRRSHSFIFIQALLGAIAALVMTWIGAERLLAFDGANLSAFVGFLSGFSEPFFLGTMGRLAELGTSPPTRPKADSKRPE
jgi:hypothetical protein